VTTLEAGSARFRQLSRLSQREFAGEVLVLNLDRDNIEHLQGTAVEVWRLLQAPRTLPALVTLLARKYDVSVETIRADVAALLGDLIARDLVEEVTENDG
jgi:hypothetical protein